MFTFGVLAFLIGGISFIVSLFCLILGKLMGESMKGSVLITFLCLMLMGLGVLCMGPISITRGGTATNTSTTFQYTQNDNSNKWGIEDDKRGTTTEVAGPLSNYENTTDYSDSAIDAIGDLEVDKRLFSVTLTMPKDFVGETTQAELDSIAKERGYKSVTLNADGSATYVMTKAQHKELLETVADSINEGISDIIGSSDYPGIIDIRANSNYTNFTVVTRSVEVNLDDSLVALSLYADGGLYGIVSGNRPANIHIDFVNADSGEIIATANSSGMEY